MPDLAPRVRCRSKVAFSSVVLLLSACVSAPRGPAGTLADAGIATTSAFATDYRATAARLRSIDTSEAFTATYQQCSNPNLSCSPSIPSSENYAARQALARTIELRGRASDELGRAYKALRTEADYDARGDMQGATNDAIEGVNSFASAILAIGGAAPAASLISQPLQKIGAFGAGLLADRAQKKRLIGGSNAIAPVTRRLRDALAVEAFVFDSLSGTIEQERLNAKQTALQSGIASSEAAITPFLADLGLEPAKDAEGVIRGSNASKIGLSAVLASESRTEVESIRARYALAISSLDDLLDGHADLAAGRPVDLADLERNLRELDAALTIEKKGD